MGQVAAQFAYDIGGPSELLLCMTPHGSKAPLQIYDAVLDLHKKDETLVPVRRHLVSEEMAYFEGYLCLH